MVHRRFGALGSSGKMLVYVEEKQNLPARDFIVEPPVQTFCGGNPASTTKEVGNWLEKLWKDTVTWGGCVSGGSGNGGRGGCNFFGETCTTLRTYAANGAGSEGGGGGALDDAFRTPCTSGTAFLNVPRNVLTDVSGCTCNTGYWLDCSLNCMSVCVCVCVRFCECLWANLCVPSLPTPLRSS